MFDTGSSDLWLPSSKCVHVDRKCGKNQNNFQNNLFKEKIFFKINKETFNLYDSSASSTYIPNNKNFSILYGDGTKINGILSQDTISISGITVTNQIFAEATQFDLTSNYDVISLF